MKAFRLLFALCCFPLAAHAQNEWVLQPYIEVTGTRALQELGKNVKGFMGSFPNNSFNVAVSEVGQTGLYTIHSPNDKTPQRIYVGENVMHGDFNGDRYTDFAIWKNLALYPIDTVMVYFGNATGIDTLGGVIMQSEPGHNLSNFGQRMCSGDINSDGFDDLVITASQFGNAQGKVYLYMGDSNFDSLPDFTILGEYSRAIFGVNCAVGDLNADHFADVVIRGNNSQTPNFSFGYLNIYFGGAQFDTTKDLTSIRSPLNGPTDGLSIFDANGDSIVDLLWAYRDSSLNTNKILIHFGDNDFSERFVKSPDFIIPNPDSQRVGVSGFGNVIANAGDMNGDGDDDIAIGAYYSFQGGGFVFVYTGGKVLDAKFDAAKGQAVEGQFGRSIDGVGDVNGDGLSDIIVGAPDWKFITRQGYWGIFLGDRRIPTSVQEKTDKNIPSVFSLSPNYPNPFNAGTRIQFSLPKAGELRMQIFDVKGALVRRLAQAYYDAGTHFITWDGRDAWGQPCASGVYLLKLSVFSPKGGEVYSATQKLLLTR